MRIAVLAFPGCQLLDVIAPLEVFSEVNRRTGKQVYEVEVVSDGASPLTGCSGIALVPSRTIFDPVVPVDTLLVAGGPEMQEHLLSDAEMKWIKETAAQSRRFGSICSGAFIMAQTGLFAGKRITTHWSKAARLAKKYPELALEPDAIYIRDGAVCTSAGVTTGIDLSLALVEEDCGRNVALDTARELVVYLQRTGGQSQFSAHLSAQMSSVPHIEQVQTWIADNLTADLRVDNLSKHVGMSPRNFARTFLKETGVTPGDFVELARLDLARRLITDNVPLQRVATQSGFQTIANLRRAFERRLMTTPSSYRDNFAKDHGRKWDGAVAPSA